MVAKKGMRISMFPASNLSISNLSDCSYSAYGDITVMSPDPNIPYLAYLLKVM